MSTPSDDIAGVAPQVDSSLSVSEETQYAFNTETEVLACCRSNRDAAKNIISNARQVTRQLNGQPPRKQADLERRGRGWYPNISTRTLRQWCKKVPPRLYGPVLSAEFLTGAALPDDRPEGADKSSFIRTEFTRLFRRWTKQKWFWRQLGREVGFFGFGFAVWLDEWDWRPTFIRQDEGFIPQGTRVIDEVPENFVVAYDYTVPQLLKVAERARKAGVEGWNYEAVANAINSAETKQKDAGSHNARKYEELVRQATTGQCYEKGYRVIQTWHLFSTDPDGSISHHIVLADEQTNTKATPSSEDSNARTLFVRRQQFDSMRRVVVPVVFDVDDGTVHGSWGAGQLLFDLAIQFEMRFNDWLAASQNIAKLKTVAGDGKNTDEVKLIVQDHMMILGNAEYAGNNAAVSSDPTPYTAVLQGLASAARELIGNYIPPIDESASDVKSSHIKVQAVEQAGEQRDSLDIWLSQVALIAAESLRRACLEGTPDEEAQAFQMILATKVTHEEIALAVRSASEMALDGFTESSRARQAQFCQAKAGNPYYNARNLEVMQARAVGGRAFQAAIMLPGDDATVEREARRNQGQETGAMLQGIVQDVLPGDPDWYHMQELRPVLEQRLQQGAFDATTVGLFNHYLAHWVGGTNKKTLPKDRINLEKAFLAKVEKTLKTGELPQEGFADQPNAVDAASMNLQTEPVVTPPGSAAPTSQ
jgi:hypothetical protein